MAALFSVCCFTAMAEVPPDVLIASGTSYTFTSAAGHSFGTLSNGVAAAELTVSQDGSTWNFFTNLTGCAASTSVLDNVSFDFSKGPIFNPLEVGMNDRQVLLQNGSVVTNAGTVNVGGGNNGTSGTHSSYRNAIAVTDGSSLYAVAIVLGRCRYRDQESSVSVSGGSHLHCFGSLDFSLGTVPADSVHRSGNVFAASGAGTTVAVDGSVNLSGFSHNVGGNMLDVADGAAMNAETLTVGCSSSSYSGARTMGDAVRVRSGGVLVTTTCTVDAGRAAKIQGNVGSRFEVLDGGAYTNAETFTWGNPSASYTGCHGLSIVVSNGTFSVGTLRLPSGSGQSNLTVVVSGEDAEFAIREPESQSRFFNSSAGHNSWIFENGAKYVSHAKTFGYTTKDPPFHDDRIAVRTGATFCFTSFGTGMGSYYDAEYVCSNVFSVESGAVATGELFRVCGTGCDLSVSNALFVVTDKDDTAGGAALVVGFSSKNVSFGCGTNCFMTLRGSSPRVLAAQGGVSVMSCSTLVYELPAEGYAAGVVPVEAKKNIRFDANSGVVLKGMAEMLARHAALGKSGSRYVLMRGGSGLNIPDAVLEKTKASLPQDVKLYVRSNESSTDLVLRVGHSGLTVSVR